MSHYHSPRDVRALVLGAGLFIGGWMLFFKGFRKLKEKNVIDAIPQSKVRSAAMGLVELQGKALGKPITTPYSQTECVYYHYTVEEYVRSSKSSYWKVIGTYDSHEPFLLRDETGDAFVVPFGAEIEIPVKNVVHTSDLAASDQKTKILTLFSLSLSGAEFRIQERYIVPEEAVCVVGSAMLKTDDSIAARKTRVMERLRDLKVHPQELAKFDVNHDGTISVEEWDAARVQVESEVSLEIPQHKSEWFIGKDQNEYFVITNSSRRELVRQLSKHAFLGIFGGTLLATAGAMLIYLVLQGGF